MWLWRVPMFPMKEAARRGCHLDVFLGAVDSVLPSATCCGWIFCVPVRFYLFIISRLGGKNKNRDRIHSCRSPFQQTRHTKWKRSTNKIKWKCPILILNKQVFFFSLLLQYYRLCTPKWVEMSIDKTPGRNGFVWPFSEAPPLSCIWFSTCIRRRFLILAAVFILFSFFSSFCLFINLSVYLFFFKLGKSFCVAQEWCVGHKDSRPSFDADGGVVNRET